MRGWRSVFRKLTKYIAGAVITFVLVPLGGEFFIRLAEERGWYKNPSAEMVALLHWAADIVKTASWFHWIGGALIGICVGAWIDALLKGSEPPTPLQSEIKFVRTVLRLKFSGKHEVPEELYKENIKDWFVYWSPGGDIRDQAGNSLMSIPSSWVVFVNFVEATKYDQLLVVFTGDRPRSYQVRRSLTTSAVITIEGQMPSCEMEIINRWRQ